MIVLRKIIAFVIDCAYVAFCLWLLGFVILLYGFLFTDQDKCKRLFCLDPEITRLIDEPNTGLPIFAGVYIVSVIIYFSFYRLRAQKSRGQIIMKL